MRLIGVNTLKENDKLAYSIMNQEGLVLLPSGTPITKTYLLRLKAYGIENILIEDDFFEDVVVNPTLQTETKTMVISTLVSVMLSIENKKPLNFAAMEKCAKAIVGDIGINITEPINILNMYAIKDARCHHAINVATIAAAIAARFAVKNDFNLRLIEELVIAALLHDACLKTMDEDSSDKTHCEKIYQLLKSYSFISVRTYTSCYAHHEHFDGSGFPRKLVGDDIYIGARILALADLYDNLLHGYGQYKKMKEHEAYEFLNAQHNTKIDGRLLPYFNETVSVYPCGVTVKLNNGYNAVVVGQTKIPSRPKVRLSMLNKEDCLLFDLTTEKTLFIEKIVV